jgi:hypothetical protein
MTSIYRQHFEAIEGVTDKVKCAVENNGKKCGKQVDSKKASNLQFHLKEHHAEFYATIQASPKPTRQPNQSSLDNFAVATPGKSSGSMRELQMYYATSTAAINDLSNPYLRVIFFIDFINLFHF